MDDLHTTPDNRNETVTILNPSAEDFTLEVVDIYQKGSMNTYTIKSFGSLKLPRYAANHVSERLAQYMERNQKGVLTQAKHKDLLNKIRMYEVKEP